MSTPLFVGSNLQVTWWANEKEENFASNYIFFYLFRAKKINLDKFQSLKLTGISRQIRFRFGHLVGTAIWMENLLNCLEKCNTVSESENPFFLKEIYVSTSPALINHFPLLSTSRTKFYGGKKTQRFILLSLKLTKSRDPLEIIDPRILLITRLLTDLSFLITCFS